MGHLFLYDKDRYKRNEVLFMTYQFKNVCGHIEVLTGEGKFLFSADTEEEALSDISLQSA